MDLNQILTALSHKLLNCLSLADLYTLSELSSRIKSTVSSIRYNNPVLVPAEPGNELAGRSLVDTVPLASSVQVNWHDGCSASQLVSLLDGFKCIKHLQIQADDPNGELVQALGHLKPLSACKSLSIRFKVRCSLACQSFKPFPSLATLALYGESDDSQVDLSSLPNPMRIRHLVLTSSHGLGGRIFLSDSSAKKLKAMIGIKSIAIKDCILLGRVSWSQVIPCWMDLEFVTLGSREGCSDLTPFHKQCHALRWLSIENYIPTHRLLATGPMASSVQFLQIYGCLNMAAIVNMLVGFKSALTLDLTVDNITYPEVQLPPATLFKSLRKKNEITLLLPGSPLREFYLKLNLILRSGGAASLALIDSLVELFKCLDPPPSTSDLHLEIDLNFQCEVCDDTLCPHYELILQKLPSQVSRLRLVHARASCFLPPTSDLPLVKRCLDRLPALDRLAFHGGLTGSQFDHLKSILMKEFPLNPFEVLYEP